MRKFLASLVSILMVVFFVACTGVDSHTHDYTAVVTSEATCTEAGVITYTCDCGDSYTEAVAPLGHNYTSEITKAATETEAGVITYTCLRCKSTYTEEIPAAGSGASEPESGGGGSSEPATCSHTWNYGVITTAATCTTTGTKTYTCTICGTTKEETIAALGHNYENGVCTRCNGVDPDYKAAGITNITYTTGGDSIIDSGTYDCTLALDHEGYVTVSFNDTDAMYICDDKNNNLTAISAVKTGITYKLYGESEHNTNMGTATFK